MEMEQEIVPLAERGNRLDPPYHMSPMIDHLMCSVRSLVTYADQWKHPPLRVIGIL